MAWVAWRSLLREQVAYVVISFLAVSAEPALAQSQAAVPEPAVFSEPLSLSRGAFSPASPDGLSLARDLYCEVMVEEWGWDTCDGVEAMVVGFSPAVDTVIVDVPNSEGHVDFSDWRGAERADAVRAIEAHLRQSSAAQSAKVGQSITFAGWRVEPTLETGKGYLYYAYDVIWDGERVTNIAALAFDRQGYVEFSIVPMAPEPDRAATVALIDEVLGHYAPRPDQRYASFVSGDRVASAGAVGVLAATFGLRYGKAATAGALAVALLLLKKGGVLLLLPVIWARRLFRRRGD